MLALGGMLLLIGLYKYKTINIRKRNHELETEVANRTSDLMHLNQRLKQTADSDFLTGLPNRLAFIKRFEEWQLKHHGSMPDTTIVLTDIDHFKQINDEHGHDVGDEVLRRVSQEFKSTIRESDFVARWGGEEFIFCLTHCNQVQAKDQANRIRELIKQSPIDLDGGSIHITATFGVCQFTEDMSLEDCINLADQALYHGKRTGRDSVVVKGETL